eukprot:749274-Hanusia_phi.AAC.3
MGGVVGKGRRRGWEEAEVRSRRAREEGKVELNLSSLSLLTLPELSLLLPLLEHLDLSNNKLPSFPDELWGMQALRWLNLSGNMIEGVGRGYSDARRQLGLYRCEEIDLSSNRLQDWPIFLSKKREGRGGKEGVAGGEDDDCTFGAQMSHKFLTGSQPSESPNSSPLGKPSGKADRGRVSTVYIVERAGSRSSSPPNTFSVNHKTVKEAMLRKRGPCFLREFGSKRRIEVVFIGPQAVRRRFSDRQVQRKKRDTARSAESKGLTTGRADPNLILSWKAISSMCWETEPQSQRALSIAQSVLEVHGLGGSESQQQPAHVRARSVFRQRRRSSDVLVLSEFDLPALKKLDLSHNLIFDVRFHMTSRGVTSAVPIELMSSFPSCSRLSALQDLDLSSNAIKDIRAVCSSSCDDTDLPCCCSLPGLTTGNQVAMCPVLERLFFKNNPVCSPPKDVLDGGLPFIQNWVRTNRQTIMQEYDRKQKQEGEEKKKLHDLEMEARYQKELADDDDND